MFVESYPFSLLATPLVNEAYCERMLESRWKNKTQTKNLKKNKKNISAEGSEEEPELQEREKESARKAQVQSLREKLNGKK